MLFDIASQIEVQRLEACEAIIEKGLKTFVEVGSALTEIRDGRLYKNNYSTFEEYCKERWGWGRNYTNKIIAASEVMSNLGTIVPILPATETQARPLTQLEPEAQRDAWKQVIETAPETGITAAHVQAVVDEIQNKPHVSFNSGNNEWYTPIEYIEAARRVMGCIDLDPASSEIANETVKATVYLSEQDDGLKYTWDGKVWMNPPYSSELIGQFTEKLTNHYQAGDITEAIILVNNATETAWFQGMLSEASAVCFPRRRIKFIDMQGNPSGAPLQGQAVLYMGDNTELFGSVFNSFGVVLYGK